MTICYWGAYNPVYSRSRVIIKGLQKNNIKVIECNCRHNEKNNYFALIKKHWAIRNSYDIMLVAFPGHFLIPLAKILTRKKIIFDAFYSLYDTRIMDKKYFDVKNIMAFWYHFVDWFACKLSDKILLDTNEHIDYFSKEFKINPSKFIRILVGSDDEKIRPSENSGTHKNFTVHFHGYFIPLQGIGYIIRAAKILEKQSVIFNIIGCGQTYDESLALANKLSVKNVNFIKPAPYEHLTKYMSEADVCLGIFGKTSKAQRVIPNKVYEALAAKRAVITGRSKAIDEILTDGVNVLLCKMGDENDLAEKILYLKNNPKLIKSIAQNGHNYFKDNLTPKLVVKDLVKIININCQ